MKFTFAPESRPLDGYTIKRAIHRGGFGEVYYAVSDSGREVALKLLQHNTEIELRGVQQCLNLSHPNLVTIFDVRQDADEDHWIIMEYVSGDTLDAVIRKHPGGMPMEQVRHWVRGIVSGMQYLHQRGLVHRDLKPGNIFSQGEEVKIGDIGLSKFITHSRRSAQTQSVGTVYYMAPEVAKGRYGKEVDIYGLGVMVFEMLTGELPFDGESTGEILMKHLTERPDLSKLPPRLRTVIGKALEKDPGKRYSSMQEFGTAFENAVVGRNDVPFIPTGQVPPPPSRPATKSRNSGKAELPSWVGEGHVKVRPAVPRQSRFDTEPRVPAMSWRLSRLGWATLLVLFAVATALMLRLRNAPWPFLSLGVCLVGVGYFWMLIIRSSPFAEIRRLAVLFFEPLAGSAKPSPEADIAATAAAGGRANRRVVGQYLSGAALAVPVVALLTAGMYLIAPQSFVENLQLAGPAGWSSGTSIEVLLYFAASAVATIWTVLLLPVSSRTWNGKETNRRLPYAFAGIVLGLIVWGLGEYLLIHHRPSGGVFEELGDHRLFTLEGSPTILGCVAFFLPLLTLRHWHAQLTPTRNKRLSITAVLGTVLLAWCISHVFAFPHFLAAAWAAVVSIAVQLCSPWYERIPPRPR